MIRTPGTRGVLTAVGSCAAGAALVSAALLLGAGTRSVAGHGRAAERTDVHAFTTATALFLAEGSQVLVSAAADALLGPAQWTQDGEHVFALTDQGVVVIDAASARVSSFPCRCEGVGPLGTGDVAWVVGGSLHRRTLADGHESVDPRPLPIAYDSGDSPVVVGGDGEVVHLWQGRYSGATRLYALAPGGASQEVPLPPIDIPVQREPVDVEDDVEGYEPAQRQVLSTTSGDHGLVVRLRMPISECEVFDSVVVVRRDGTTAEFSPAGEAGWARTVNDAWWSRDGSVRFSLTRTDCRFEGQGATTWGEKPATAVWGAGERGWEQVSEDGVLGVRELPSGADVVLRTSGELVFQEPGGPQHTVEFFVTGLSAPRA